MNTQQLESILNNCPLTGKCFIGVYPSDTFPQISNERPCSFVWNLAKSNDSGIYTGHWVAVYITSGNVAYYSDSAGLLIPKEFQTFLASHSKLVKPVFKRRVQDLLSDVCGEYVLFFLIAKSKALSNRKIRKFFSLTDFKQNDTFVLNWLKSHKNACAPCGYKSNSLIV
jgi:hypothetical protein